MFSCHQFTDSKNDTIHLITQYTNDDLFTICDKILIIGSLT